MHNAPFFPHGFAVTETPPLLPPAPKPPTYQPAASWLVRSLLRLLAIASLCLGIAGIFIPGLPTTVFVLIAGWAATRSSPRLHAWLWQHRLFGPMLLNWSQGGKISRKAKRSATAMMALCSLVLWLAPTPFWAQVLASTCMVCVLAWLWWRPEP